MKTRYFIMLLLIASVSYAGVDKSGVKPSVLSLPSGPGSIEGLGESFEPQLNSGTAVYQVKLSVPPGRRGFAPEISLNYNSGNGNGFFGLGWKADIPCIQRQTDKGLPSYADTDTFIFSEGEEIVSTADGSFRFKNESGFIKFSRLSSGWTGIRKDGITLRFGTKSESRIEDGSGKIFKWLIDDMTDTNGNQITFFYEKKDAGFQKYCTKIEYNGMSVVFEYEQRPDVITDYHPRYELKTAYRCKAIRMMIGTQQIRSYVLSYAPTDNYQPLSLLSAVTQFGKDGQSSLPPAQFTYTKFEGNTAKPQSMPSAPQTTLNDRNIEFTDLNADGLPDILDTNENPHSYYLNLGPDNDGKVGWSAKTYMTSPSALKLAANSVQLADMEGNGQANLLNLFSTDLQYYRARSVGNGLAWESGGLITTAGFSFEDPNVRMVDLNNDKMTDVMKTAGSDAFVWMNMKNGQWNDALIVPLPNSQLGFDRSYIRLADMNGDRIQDIVWLQNDICVYYPGKGFGEFGAAVYMQNSPSSVFDESRLLMADVNGDGMDDVIYVAEGSVRVWINLGLDPADHSQGRFADPFTISAPYTTSITVFRQCDINGNGSKDIVWNTHPGGGDDTFAYSDFVIGEKPYQLKTITNGIGRTVTISYRSSIEEMIRDRDAGKSWTKTIPFPVPVVSAIRLSDGLNTYITEFQYHNGYYDGKEKEFRGFAKADKKEVGDASAPDFVMAYQFDIGDVEESLKGKPLLLEAHTANGEIFYRESNNWLTKKLADGANGDVRKIMFPYQQAKIRDVIEKDLGTPVQMKWEYDYDNFGNMTRQIEYGRTDAGWNDERITQTSYTAAYPSGQTKWILDKVVETTITDLSGTLVARKQNYYDGSSSLGEIVKGNLTKVNDWVSGSKWITSVRNDYDGYGNIIATYDPMYGSASGHYRKLVYDSVYHTFPVEEQIYTGSATLTMSAAYDFGFGKMTSSTDFNGFTTSYGYDTFGRLIYVTKPPDSGHTVEYNYVLAYPVNGKIINWVETRQKDGSSDGFLKSRTFYDGLSRKIMTRTEGENSGQVVVTDTVQFNARKLPIRKYLPYFENGSLGFIEPTFNTGFTEHFYDAMGREIRVNQPAGAEGIAYSTTTYQPLLKIVRDEEQTNPSSPHYGAGMRYVEDGLQDKDGKGRLRQVYEIVKLTNAGEPISGISEWRTSYDYDLQDNLTHITDSQNNQKFMQYDGVKRKTYMNDPDRGKMYYAYDDAGNLIKTTDAKAQVISYSYDGVNRLTAEYYGKAVPDVEYHYDTPYGALEYGDFWQPDPTTISDVILKQTDCDSGCDANKDGKVDVADVIKSFSISKQTATARNTKGFLSYVKDQSGEEHNSYDSRGRVEWVIKRIANTDNLKNFHTATEYDSMDRVTKLTYPDQTYISYTYNSRGLPETISGVIDRYDYNPAGQNSLLSLSCGISSSYQYDHRLRLKQLSSARNSVSLQNLSYSYDGVSNITAIQDARSSSDFDTIATELGISSDESKKFNASQSFGYDSLYRLISASNASIYGTISYRYDRIGNMSRKDAGLIQPDSLMDLGTMTSGGNAGTWSRSGRNPGDAPGPHAITATAKGTNGAMSFAYDDNGNMISDNGMNLLWDYKDRLVSLKKGAKTASHTYDYSDTRKKKIVTDSGDGSSAETVYIDKYSEIRNGKLLKYVYAGNSRIARAEAVCGGSNEQLRPSAFYLQDHLGSTAFTLSDNGTVTEQIVNYPYGNPRLDKKADSAKAVADYKFTGKEQDVESGLQYFEARYYSGVLARFIRGDRLFEKTQPDILNKPQIFNLYSYANGNPIKYIDPDGNKSINTYSYMFYLSKKMYDNPSMEVAVATMALFSFEFHNIGLDSSSGGFQKASGNTSLEGIRPNTYWAIIALRYSYLNDKYKSSLINIGNHHIYGVDMIDALLTNNYRPAYTGELIITGATEPGHSKGKYSHGTGYKIDLKATPELNDYITTYGVETGKRGKATGYELPGINGTFWDERNIPGVGPHWDFESKER